MSRMHPSGRAAGRARRRCAGFSLVEVLVALIVISIGLLGLAKMASLGIASTNVAGTRSLAAIEAASLASMMHADRAYWAGGFAPASFTISGGPGVTTAISDTTLQANPACTTAGTSACVPADMAAHDVNTWAADLASVLPPYLATVDCSTVVGTAVSCAIQIQWAENGVAINAQQQGNMNSLAAPTYILYVVP
ncbi:MAG TPA: prepilin-type N-terminal cleavage/methylation domain-containing protein [Steroidobacteraceae bacterium]|nr:prepilin-type N-terminal cleavage/methylation domain-containing protein [Steroidobacteraceae bacterium]